MQAETKFKERVRKALDKRKPKLWYTKIQQLAKRGDPDFLICANGHFVAWELKVGANVATPLQEYTLHSIQLARGAAVEVYPNDLEVHLKALDMLLLSPIAGAK